LKVLIKYISKLSVWPFLIGLGGFVIFVSVEILYQLSDIIVRHRVGIAKLLLLIYYYLPYFVSMGIPVGILLSIFWIVSQLSNDREMMAFQVHGISLKSLLLPFLIISLFLSGITYYLSDYLVPAYNTKVEDVLSKYVYRRPQTFIAENILTKLGENQYFYVKKYDEKNETLWDVVLFRYGKEESIITAKKVVKEKGKWYLYDGKYYTVDKDGFLKIDARFSKMELDIEKDLENYLRLGKSPREMKGSEIRSKIIFFKKVGIDTAPLIVELYSRYANALGPLIIVLVGIPLSLLFNFKSKSWGVIFTFILVVLYQGSSAWLCAMGKERLISPNLAPWIPDIVFSISGLLLFILLDTTSAYRIREILSKFFIFLVIILPVTLGFSTEVTITADHVMKYRDKVVFSGNVEVHYKDSVTKASTLVAILNDEGKVTEVVSEGTVTYVKKDIVLNVEKMRFIFEEERAFIAGIRGESFFKDEKGKKHKVYIGGTSGTVERGLTGIKYGYVTTCNLAEPHYKISAVFVELKENEYMVAYHAIFHILGIPVMYYPIYFSSLKGGPQPLIFSFSLSSKEGLIITSTYNIPYSSTGLVTITRRSVEKGEKAGRYITLEWKDKVYGKDMSMSFSRSSEDSYTLSFKISKLAFILPSTFSFSHRVTGDTFNTVLNLSGIEKVGKGKYGYVLERKSTSSNVSYKIPYVFAEKVSIPTPIGDLAIQKFSHKGDLSYKEGNFFDHLKDMSSSGNYTMVFATKEWYILKSVKTTLKGSYSFKEFGLVNHQNLLDFLFDLKGFSIGTFPKYSFDHNILIGFKEKKDEDMRYRIANVFKNTLAFSAKGFSFVLAHNYVDAFGKSPESFSSGKNANFLNISSKMSFPPLLNTTISMATKYDFMKKERNWSDPKVETTSSFSIGSVDFSIKTSTLYKLYEPEKTTTKYTFSQAYGSLKNSVSFLYRYGEEKHVKEITDILKISGREFLFMRRPSLTLKTIFELETKKVKKSTLSGSFYIGKAKNKISLSYVKDSYFKLTYGLSSFDPTVSISLTSKKRDSEWKMDKMTLKIGKSLHCWGMSFESSFGKDLKVEKLAFKFYIKEFPDKGFSFDPKTGEFGFSLF